LFISNRYRSCRRKPTGSERDTVCNPHMTLPRACCSKSRRHCILLSSNNAQPQFLKVRAHYPNRANLKLTGRNTDAIASCSPSFLHDLDGRPSGLPLHPRPALVTIPLSRGTANEHPIQPNDEVLRFEILVIHDCWLRCVCPGSRRCTRDLLLTFYQELHSQSQFGRQRSPNR
jgi:hypothetical protein